MARPESKPARLRPTAFVPVSEMRGDSAKDTELLQTMHRGAREFLSSHSWCKSIADDRLGFGVGGVIAAFLFKVTRTRGRAERLWVIEGDLPSAYLVTDRAKTSHEALVMYVELMRDWIAAVRSGTGLKDVFPVRAAATKKHASMLESRLRFLEKQIVPLARRFAVERTTLRRATRKRSVIRPGDLIVDNLFRAGVVVSSAPRPGRTWLAMQNDKRVRKAKGPWWKVYPLDGGVIVAPEDLVTRRRRATIDDVRLIVENDAPAVRDATGRVLMATLGAPTL